MSSSNNGTAIQDTAQLKKEDYGPQLNGTIWFLTTVSALFMGLRLYAKGWRKRPFLWDDYFLVAGWVSTSYTNLR